jgi:hypothetical protein
MFLTTTESARRADYLQRALDAYLGAYNAEPQDFWHGINAAALLARAARDGITVSGTSNAALAARGIAVQVLKTVDEQPQRDQWAKATACEASVALGLHDEAVRRGAVFVEDSDTDAFAIASLERQLLEVWELDTTTPLGNALLPVLRGALLEKDGGSVLLATRDVGAPRLRRLADADLKTVGIERSRQLAWYRTGLLRCRAVARIENLNEDGIGTGFLVNGAALHGSLPERVLITNGHVIPEGLDPRNAVVAFHGLDTDALGPNHFRVLRRWWYEPSSSPQLDTTVLELDGYPEGVEPIPLASQLPARTPSSRAYLIGHPRGLQQPQFSLQDNLILDGDDTRLHYSRSHAEGAISGSPVFDDHWQLIGLHHAGGVAMPRLNNQPGTYPANEAITIDAIRNALAERPPAAVDVD